MPHVICLLSLIVFLVDNFLTEQRFAAVVVHLQTSYMWYVTVQLYDHLGNSVPQAPTL